MSAVAADIAGVTHHTHQPPDAAGARHRRAVPADDRARHHDDRRHPGPAAPGTGPMCCCGRRRFARWPSRGVSASADGTVSDGALRVRFGEVEARGVALTPQGRERYDAAMAAAGPGRGVGRVLPRHRRGDGRRTGWPTTAAAIRRNPLSTRTSCPRRRPASSGPTSIPTRRPPRRPTIPTTASTGWPARSGTTFTIRTSSTRKPHHHDHRSDIHSCPPPRTCATESATRCSAVGCARRPRRARRRTGCRPARRSPATCCSPSPRPRPEQADARDSRSGAGVYDVAHHARARAGRAGGPARRAARRAQGRSRRRS